MSSTRVTRNDVARYAGVSSAVVSYVLNNTARPVAPATRERVLQAIEVLGYRPNAVARALTLGRSDAIAVLVPDQRNAFFANLIAEIDDAAHERGKTLLIRTADSPRRLADPGGFGALLNQQLDGVIVADTLSHPDIALAERAAIPLVFINQFIARSTHPSLGSDFHAGARIATEHLLALGHRTIAFVGFNDPNDARERGWGDALADAGTARGPIVYSDESLALAYRIGATLRREHPEVTAVFAASDRTASGVVAGLQTAGAAVPRDVSVVGFDGTPEGEFLFPALTSVRQPIAEMARDAVNRLLAAPTESGHHQSYPVELIVRASTAPPRPVGEDAPGDARSRACAG